MRLGNNYRQDLVAHGRPAGRPAAWSHRSSCTEDAFRKRSETRNGNWSCLDSSCHAHGTRRRGEATSEMRWPRPHSSTGPQVEVRRRPGWERSTRPWISWHLGEQRKGWSVLTGGRCGRIDDRWMACAVRGAAKRRAVDASALRNWACRCAACCGLRCGRRGGWGGG
jgi:hypothetical protein